MYNFATRAFLAKCCAPTDLFASALENWRYSGRPHPTHERLLPLFTFLLSLSANHFPIDFPTLPSRFTLRLPNFPLELPTSHFILLYLLLSTVIPTVYLPLLHQLPPSHFTFYFPIPIPLITSYFIIYLLL